MSATFYCRIRPPTQYEQLNSPSSNFPVSRSISPLKSPKQQKPSSNLSNHMFNIFTCPAEKTPQTVICNENPIKGKLIETNFLKERDLEGYKSSILEKARFFQFDRVFNLNSSQNSIFIEVCKEKVQNLLKGSSSAVLFYGPNS